MPETTELRELTRKRGGVNHKLNNFVKHVVPIYNTFKVNPSLDDEIIIELQNRFDKLEIIYNEFEGIHLEIECLSPDDFLEGQYKEQGSYVMLSTVCAYIYDRAGNPHICNCLLDNGSQPNFVTSNLVRNLELDEIPVNISINGVSNVVANVRSKWNVRLASMHNNFNLKLSCYVLLMITGCLPNVKVNISDWKLPDNVSLANPKFNIPKQIGLLIGASHFWKIDRAGIIHLGKGMPVLQNTEFGYTVTGQVNNDISDSYGKPQVTDKDRNDVIRQGRNTWLIVKALENAITDQRKIIEQHYGKPELESHQQILSVYDSSHILDQSLQYEDETCHGICEDVLKLSDETFVNYLLHLTMTVFVRDKYQS
ncbi:hypothetical protein ILUMI_23891 [Ignelater luminosus]|uniref:Peptidase aspartic putative domain-containing protein n=1 Tax=Ignelater luminosus TaxID=2038154 RepID=A0A8K0G167_IGNLU|nr:hypothetical protein ILUMI_23891 [Ignelater luminosus]